MLSFASQYDIKVNGQGQTIYFAYLGFRLFHKVTQRKWFIDYIEKNPLKNYKMEIPLTVWEQ